MNCSKTQLVARYVYQLSRISRISIFWIKADSKRSLEEGYARIAKALSGSKDSDYIEGTNVDLSGSLELEKVHANVQTVHAWMQADEEREWMLVLDNYDDIRINVRPFLPPRASYSGKVVITTRDRRVVGSIADHGIGLTRMNVIDSQRLLLRLQSSGQLDESVWMHPETHPEFVTIEKIVDELDGFPLALEQASAFLRENGPMQFSEYLVLLNRDQDRELLLRFKEANPDYPESVMTTWEVSFRYIVETNERASKILRLFACLDSVIEEKLLTSAAESAAWGVVLYPCNKLPPERLNMLEFLQNGVEFRVAIGVLVSLSLVQREASSLGSLPVLSVHPLVHEWMKIRMDSRMEEYNQFLTIASITLYQVFPFEHVTELWPRTVGTEYGLSYKHHELSRHFETVLENFTRKALTSNDFSVPIELLLLQMVLCQLHCFPPSGKRNQTPRPQSTLPPITSPANDHASKLLVHMCEARDALAGHQNIGLQKLPPILEHMLAEASSTPAESNTDKLILTMRISFVLKGIRYLQDYDEADHDAESSHYTLDNFAHTNRKKLMQLCKLLWESLPRGRNAVFFDVVRVAVGYQLADLMTIQELQTFELAGHTSVLDMNLLPCVTEEFFARYLCKVARVAWERQPTPDEIDRDVNQVHRVVMKVFSESTRILDKETIPIVDIYATSGLSSSFGRFEDSSRARSGLQSYSEDLERTANALGKDYAYIWSIIVPLSDALEKRMEHSGSDLLQRFVDLAQRVDFASSFVTARGDSCAAEATIALAKSYARLKYGEAMYLLQKVLDLDGIWEYFYYYSSNASILKYNDIQAKPYNTPAESTNDDASSGYSRPLLNDRSSRFSLSSFWSLRKSRQRGRLPPCLYSILKSSQDLTACI